jgi:hypothetical protein
LSQRQKIPQTVHQRLRRHPRPWLEDDQPSAAFRRESEHLTEIMIQGDEGPGLVGQTLNNLSSEAPWRFWSRTVITS